jgi:LPS-assembly protein
MKSKIFFIFSLFFFKTVVFAENLNISAEKITLDKVKNISVFENNVTIVTEDGYKINSDYTEYDKEKGYLLLKKNISAIDNENNIIQTNFAEFFKNKNILKTKGPTKIITTNKYEIELEELLLDNNKNYIESNKKATIKDQEGNKIFLENFKYQKTSNIFKSIGAIKIIDKNDNTYQFSQIYIDTKKNEILGTDIKTYINQYNFKENKDNKPRVFANSIEIKKNKTIFDKSVFTTCDYRENNKCPPWTIKASKMTHDNKKKTIYYDNAILKIYDIPLFYFPKIFHPDPSVDRRSGFLPPTLVSGKNLGTGMAIPYFWNIDKDKNFTVTNRIYTEENPLFLGAYHQVFRNSYFKTDFGYTEGYKKSSLTKLAGKKSHFFSEFKTFFNRKDNYETFLKMKFQDTSDDKYLKVYKIKTDLAEYEVNKLENAIEFSHSNEDLLFDINAFMYENLEEGYNDKYEYILPNISLAKNLFKNDTYGFLDFKTNFKVHNYDTNKYEKYLTNDFQWDSNILSFGSQYSNKFLAHLKNINYETNNVQDFKEETTNELFGAFGFESSLDLIKSVNDKTHFLTPKILLRYAPGNMRKDTTDFRLDAENAFFINRINNTNNFETGLSSTLGFDYTIREKEEKKFNFSLAQIINEKENKKMSDKSSLNEKMSDLVGSASFDMNNIELRYNFAVDQNYNNFNYNDYQLGLKFNPLEINFNYLQENEHVGNEEYMRSNFKFKKENSLLSFENKRNLLTNSWDYYNLGYEYINDCLRAGLVYRREFYNDSEVEPEDSLMFRITISPIGQINAASISE